MTFRVRNLHTGGADISNPPNSDTSSAFLALRDSLRLRGEASPALLRELDSLLRESDAELQAEGFLSLAGRQEIEGRVDIAAEIYAAVVGAVRACPPLRGERPLQRRAEERLTVLSGSGPLGARIEHLSRHFAQQASDPALLVGMAVGGAVFQTFRLATLSRLAAAPTASLFTRGLGARALSWGAGFAFEVPAFTFATRGLNAALGREQDWSRQAIGRELMSAGLTLFLLKGSGTGASALTRRLAATGEAASTLTRFTTAALPQAAAFTGILGAHALETQLGLRPHSDPSHAIVDSLATLLQFHIGGRILRGVTGNSYERRLELLGQRLETTSRLEPRPPLIPPLSLSERSLAVAGEAPSLLPTILMMSTRESGRGKPGPGLEIPIRELVPQRLVPIHARPELFSALRSQFSRLEFDMYFTISEQSGEAMWVEQHYRITRELLDHLGLFDRFLPKEKDRPVLDRLTGELRQVEAMLSELRREEDLPPASHERVKEFIGALYRVPNTVVNYINNGETHSLVGSLRNAEDARRWLFNDIYRIRRVNADALDFHLADDSPRPTRLNVEADHPTKILQMPNYEFRDSFESPYLEIPGAGRKVVLIGEIPRERVSLAGQHSLELVVSDRNQYTKMASAAVDAKNLERVRITWREWKTRGHEAEYLEGYDIASAEALTSPEGRELLQEQVFSRLRPGGMALLISRDATALQRMVQIATENQWADVILGSYRGHLPVEVSRPDQESGNFVFLRKLPQF